ncbi:MAG: GNAT family N-acetyltransferase, partial [Nocardioidaceae bacterium]
LHGDLVYLRSMLESDLDQLVEWWSDPTTMIFMSAAFRPRPDEPIREQLRQWSANSSPSGVGFSVVRRADNALVGRVALWGAEPPVPSATLGIYVAPEAQGQRLGADAMRVIVRFGFEEMGLHRVQLGVYSFNTRAIAAYEKLGFVEEGRRREVALHGGEYHDEVIMAILASEYAAGRDQP